MLFDTIRNLMALVLVSAVVVLIYLYGLPGRDR